MKNMKFIIILLYILNIVINKNNVYANCTFKSYSGGERLIYLQKFGSNNLLIPIENFDQTIELEDYEKITMYCQSGFSRTRHGMMTDPYYDRYNNHNRNNEYESENITELEIYCDSPYIYTNPQCSSDVSYLYGIISSETCDHNSYAVISKVLDKNITHVEYCYDNNQFKLKFLHYVSWIRSDSLNEYIKHSTNSFDSVEKPSSLTSYNGHFRNRYSISYYRDPDIYSKLAEIIDLPGFYNNFSIGYLLPFDDFKPYFSRIVEYDKTIGNIIWLDSVKHGIWKMYQKVLREYTNNVSSDIYAGTYDIVTYPDCEKEIPLIITSRGGSKIDIPKYIWNYVKPMNNESSDEVVIVVINSPFIEWDNMKSMIFCEDICDNIPWLSKLSIYRKMESFGILFCCTPDAFVNYTKEFGKLFHPIPIPSSTTDVGFQGIFHI